MRDDTEKSATRIEGISGDTPVDLALTSSLDAADDPALDGIMDSVQTNMAAEAARQMLMGAANQLQDVANHIVVPGSEDWLSEAPNRIQAGQSDILREDLVYQTPDWERATGKRDNAISDLIG